MFTYLATAASEIGNKACSVSPDAIGCGTGLFSAGGFVFNAINTLIMIIGALSVIMIIIGGLRYVLSGGDSAGLKSAKDTILYALIGLAVSLLSFAMVSFVISRLA
jgi:hypothetical protein